MKLKEIPRTATFAWTHGPAANAVVTGTASGAIDADFNSSTQLEIWNTEKEEALFSTEVDARFHDLAVSPDNELVAGAMENGVVQLWNLAPAKLTPAGTGHSHKGPARALAFNQENKLASAGASGELFLWDTTTMQGAAPGPSSRQDDLVAVAWNNRVNQILATAGTGGFTSIWDLRKRREVIHLHYSQGSRLPTSSVSWHATNSTKLVTASSDDQNPVVLVWDLRNANSPETVLEGHSAGVLSVDWCLQDPDLLLTSGKDNRTLLWNPSNQTILAEYPISLGWTFKTRFNPRLPDLFATASFDGKLSLETLQDTSEPESGPKKASGDAFWDSEEVVDAVHPQFHHHQAPAWLKRPVSASFGFGGKLVSVRGKQVEIATFKAEATDVAALKTALETRDYAPLAGSGADWDLLTHQNEEEPKESPEPETEEFDISPEYAPASQYTLLDGKHDEITKLVLSKKLAKAVDRLIDLGEHADALLLASFDQDLLAKARNAYLEVSKKPYTRAAWASQGHLADFENVELDAWEHTLKLVKTDPSKTSALGHRLLKAGRRNDALRVFIAGNNLPEAGSIWLEELPQQEQKYLADAKSAYEAHTRALQDLVEKLLVASKGSPIEGAHAALYDTWRDFANILASQGDLDLASALLDLLPSSYAQDKGRITGAQAKPRVQKAQARAYGVPSAPVAPAPAIGVPSAPGVPRAPAAPAAGRRPPAPAAPAKPAPTRVPNPYAPANGTPVNPYAAPVAPVAPAAPVAAPAPAIPGPPKQGKVSTTIRPPQHGWNDLPEQTLQNNLKARRPAAPPIIPNQFVDKSKAFAPPTRAPSAGPKPATPPPKGGPRPPSAGPRPPSTGPGFGGPSAPPRANPYAPVPAAVPAPAPAPAPSALPAAPPSASNPYAPPPGTRVAAPVAPQPKAAPAPPPPGKARTAVAPPAAVAASLPTDTPAAPAAQAKYPPGDREHIPATAQPIYQNLSRAIETIRPTITASYPKQMKDTEKRINTLFDHLNNQDLLSQETTEKLVAAAAALDARDFDRAESLRNEIATSTPDECGTWMTGFKRLVQMASAIPA